MLLDFIKIKKNIPRENAMQSIKTMLGQTWDLSRQFFCPPDSPDSGAITIFNLFFEKLNLVMTKILKNVVALASLAPSLFEFSREFKDKSGEQERRIVGISKAGKSMAEQIGKIAENTGIVSGDSEKIKTEVKSAMELGESSVDRFTQIRQHVNGLVRTIDVLDENSKSIGDIIDVLNHISDETNILSLNARIEAARGNVDNRGFKVIAEEIAALASQSKTATGDIRDRLTILSRKVNETVEAVKMVEENVMQGQTMIVNANQSLKNVHTHFNHLAENLAKVEESTVLQSRDVKKVSEDIGDIEESVKQQVKGVETIFQVAEKVNGICEAMILDAGIFHLSGHKTAQKSAEQMALEPDILSFDRGRQEQALSAGLGQYPFIELAYITDNTGRQITDNIYACHVQGRDALNRGYHADWSLKEWFVQPAKTRHTFVSRVYRSSATYSFCFTVSVPLFRDQSFCGVLGIDINFKNMLDI